MVTKYNATITVQGKLLRSTKRIENKPMPFIINKSKEMADDINMMAYEAVVESINIRFKRAN